MTRPENRFLVMSDGDYRGVVMSDTTAADFLLTLIDGGDTLLKTRGVLTPIDELDGEDPTAVACFDTQRGILDIVFHHAPMLGTSARRALASLIAATWAPARVRALASRLNAHGFGESPPGVAAKSIRIWQARAAPRVRQRIEEALPTWTVRWLERGVHDQLLLASDEPERCVVPIGEAIEGVWRELTYELDEPSRLRTFVARLVPLGFAPGSLLLRPTITLDDARACVANAIRGRRVWQS